jgi:hypothetical protein
LPWIWTYSLLALVVVVALVRPFAPNGYSELLRRTAGVPPTLALENGHTARLIEERALEPRCGLLDLGWGGPSELILDCTGSLQVWTPDGRLVAKIATPNRLSISHMHVLRNPLRVAYIGPSGQGGSGHNVLNIWNVSSDVVSSFDEVDANGLTFSVDSTNARISMRGASNYEIWIASLNDQRVQQKVSIPDRFFSLQWLPGQDALLFGTFNGGLFTANTKNGVVRKLAQIYAADRGLVDGLAPSPDGKAVVTFETLGAPVVGTGVEVRSTNDGRLLSQMPGTANIGAREVAWDPLDRFIVCSARDTLILWNWRSGDRALMTIGELGSIAHFSINADGSALALADRGVIRIFRIQEQ